MDARSTFLAFCDKPIGAPARPFDSQLFYWRCADALDQLGSEDEDDSDCGLGNNSASVAEEKIQSVYQEIEDTCSKPTVSGTAKLGGMQTLLDIVILLETNEDLEDDDMTSEDRRLDLREGAFSVMVAICKTVAPEERRELYNSAAFKTFLIECGNYGEEDASALVQEVEEQLADCESDDEDNEDDEFDDDGYDENGWNREGFNDDGLHKDEDAEFRHKFGEDYRDYMR
jgi:hypothetical protein